jgi:hypothetical protein
MDGAKLKSQAIQAEPSAHQSPFLLLVRNRLTRFVGNHQVFTGRQFPCWFQRFGTRTDGAIEHTGNRTLLKIRQSSTAFA